MDRLSSCYFCGAALDASLDEYPVIPKGLQPAPDQQGTVVLCQGCREKLATVVERVVAAAEEGSGSAGPAASSVADTAGQDADEAAAAGEEPDETDPSINGAAAEAATGGGDGAVDETGDGDAASAAEDATAAAGETAEGADTDDGPAATERAAAGDAGSSPDSGAAADDEDDPSMTALEYNRVMRLLQNRELPVERDGIRTVATNAYDITEEEYEAVIEAALERGLIAAEDGQFVEAE